MYRNVKSLIDGFLKVTFVGNMVTIKNKAFIIIVIIIRHAFLYKSMEVGTRLTPT